MRVDKSSLPLVYSCSGCSSAAQMANDIALQLDRQGVAEMPCIAGVGGDVPQLLEIAQPGRHLIVPDGCALACSKSSLARHGAMPDTYHLLSDDGIKKRDHADFDTPQADVMVSRVAAGIAPAQPA